ncbi:GNAT family N-acetyltransferase [Pseudonocardia sp. DLS-67]
MISVSRLRPDDRARWEELFRGYIAFYERSIPDGEYERAWEAFQLDTRVHAFGARRQDLLVGIAHFFPHPHTNARDVCYLQDLFTAPEARGHGVARALIQAVHGWARERGCSQLYWHTHESNATARRLYDGVAENRGFIRYQMSI